MAERVLPEWMSKGPGSDGRDLKQKRLKMYKKNMLEDDLPYLEFSGTVIYSHEKNDCSFLSEDLRSCLSHGSAVGFDLEWPPSYSKGEKQKVALVQLCVSEEKCYLFHLSSMAGFPSGLRTLLQDETIKKVGVGIEGDMWKLLSDFDINLKNFIELGDLANDKLKCVEKWSLDGLVKHLFGQQLKKETNVRCSKWNDFQLTEEQKRYAATDAYAGFLVYKKLKNIHSSCHLSVREKLLRMARELEDLTRYITEETYTNSRADEVLEEMTGMLGKLKASLLAGNCAEKPPSSHSVELSTREEDSVPDRIEATNEPNREGPTKYNMSGMSEYEVQMLNMQTQQEDIEEQSTLEFQDQKNLNDSDLSCLIESDEDLDVEMRQCVDEVEKLSKGDKQLHKKNPMEPVIHSKAEDDEEEDEGIEEEDEEEFDASMPSPNSAQIKCLKKYFGHSSFKPVQWKVIYSALNERKDNLVVMATGYGKSLCYQFPPVYCGGVSVVISPLIALMEDQVFQLKMSNIPACFLGSAQTENVLGNLKKGHYRVVYMTPEFCSGNTGLLEQINRTIGITLIAVDEAHCISEWGHDFRGAYRNLGSLKRILSDVPILALTATASPSVREDIVKSLQLVNPVIICTSFDRPNIYLDVHRKSGDTLQDLKQFLVKKTGGRYEFEGPAIVYCPSRKEAERVLSELNKLYIQSGVYHAGLSITRRRETQHRFMRDEIQCIVATVAFGMGINKADIRKVIHYGAPKEMESYYQEIGRAGRDGLPCACHVLWAPADMVLNRFLLSKVKSDRFRGYKMKMMSKMQQYLKSHKCRRKLILSHFEDKQLRKVTSGILGTSVCCDNCRSRVTHFTEEEDQDLPQQDFGNHAYQLLSAVAALDERFGSTVPVLFLRGSNSQRVPDAYRKHPLFGAGKNISENWWKVLTRQLICEEYLKESTGHNRFSTLCKLTPKGRKWLSQATSEKHRILFLQPDPDLTDRVFLPCQSARSPAASAHAAVHKPQMDQYTRPVTNIYKAATSPSSRLLPGASCKSPVKKTKTQPPVVCPRELELQAELYGKLLTGRQKLASEKDIPPAILATNKILLDMAKLRPCTVASLKQVDGVSEAKSTMLVPLLKIIVDFNEANGLQSNISSGCQRPIAENLRTSVDVKPSFLQSLPDSVAVSYKLFQAEGKSLRQVCDCRSLPLPVVEMHLLQAFKAGYQLDTERAGLSAAVFDTITRIITSSPVNSDLSNMKVIRSAVPEHLSTFLIQLTITELQRDGIPVARASVTPSCLRGATPKVKEEELNWIEPEEKPIRQESCLAVSQLTANFAQDVCENSEDELFMDIPMPEETSDDPYKVASSSGAIQLASWNQTVDEDTQELFTDSPTQPVNQSVKRKLPEWCASRSSLPLSDTTSKKLKKKKGLFM